MQISDVNLDAFPDPATRQRIGQLLNRIETLVAERAPSAPKQAASTAPGWPTSSRPLPRWRTAPPTGGPQP